MRPRLRRRRRESAGVNLAGYFAGELGVGELGRLLVEAAERSGLPFTTRVHRRTRSRQDAAFEETAGDPLPVTVAVVNADQFPQWVEDAPDLHRDRYVIGVWAWEVERFPAYAEASLHRAEGYGLTLAEAMVRERPVVATGHWGNLDFMDESTALLVPFRRVPVGPGHRPYPPRAHWGEPDLDAAAAHLRWVHDHPAQALGERARAHHLTTRTLDRTAEFVRQRVTAAVAHG